MKRSLVFIVALIYLFTTTGASMQLHFCMDKLTGWSLFTNESDKACGKCGMPKTEKPNGCCKDEHKWVKIQDDQKTAAFHFEPASILAAPISFVQPEVSPDIAGAEELIPNSHAPPLPGETLYKRNCVFRI